MTPPSPLVLILRLLVRVVAVLVALLLVLRYHFCPIL